MNKEILYVSHEEIQDISLNLKKASCRIIYIVHFISYNREEKNKYTNFLLWKLGLSVYTFVNSFVF